MLNNLAVVYSLLGGKKNDAEAMKYFAEAIGLNHRLRPFFRRNYADFLVDQENFKEAVDQYRKTLDEEPEDHQAYQSLMKLFANNPTARQESLSETLWFMTAKGQINWTEETALQELRSPGRPPEWRREMLAILVFALGEDTYSPSEFAATPSGEALGALANDPDISSGVREILQLHAGERLDPDQYPWWSAQPQENTISAGRPAPLAAFRHLVRGLGTVSQNLGTIKQAEKYLLLSALLAPDKADVVASDMLADLAANSGETATIRMVIDRNEPPLNRPGAERGVEVYRYRRDVGILLGIHGPQGDGSTPVSAIYQLARAKELADEILLPGAGGAPVNDFDARVYTWLAARYEAIRQPERAEKTLRDLVVAFKAQGLNREAAALTAVLSSRRSRKGLPDRRRKVFDDPPLLLRDFTTEPPDPP